MIGVTGFEPNNTFSLPSSVSLGQNAKCGRGMCYKPSALGRPNLGSIAIGDICKLRKSIAQNGKVSRVVCNRESSRMVTRNFTIGTLVRHVRGRKCVAP
jgi:hypothetical protein